MTSKDVTCETNGHLWNGLGYCVMCKAVRPDWECSECGEPCNASVPHTCYADYQAIKAALKLANAQRDEHRDELQRLRLQFDRHTRSSNVESCPFCGCQERYTNQIGSCRRCGAPEDLLNPRNHILLPPWDAVSMHLREKA